MSSASRVRHTATALRFRHSRAVREAVCFVIVPVGDQTLILAADKFAGQVVVINAVCGRQSRFPVSAGQYIVTEGGVAAVSLVRRMTRPAASYFHTARQPPCVVQMAFPTHRTVSRFCCRPGQ